MFYREGSTSRNENEFNSEGLVNGKQYACQHFLHLEETRDLTFGTGSTVQAYYRRQCVIGYLRPPLFKFLSVRINCISVDKQDNYTFCATVAG